MEWKRASSNFANGFYVNPIDTAGGLSLWWTPDVNISIISSSSHFIHVMVNCNSSFLCTFVHAPTDRNERRVFWNLISELNLDADTAWLIVGDFNTVLYEYEKERGNPIRYSSAMDFRQFISNNRLMDLGALCSAAWRNTFEKAVVVHEQRIGSDHNPLNIDFYPNNRRSKPPFRFDARWLTKEECGRIIHDNWPTNEDFSGKLQLCAGQLKIWSKKAYSDSKIMENRIKIRLEDINNMTRDRTIINEERALNIQLNKLWIDENTAWRQRSFIQWDKEGDRNTRFFHSTTIYRHNRNMIRVIKNEEGVWIRGDGALGAHARDFFKTLFSARPNRPDPAQFVGIPTIVSAQASSFPSAPSPDS
ncbi:hypothetical protein LINGRAHAP2_LOCUS31245 [Linum grandiflorum]